MYFSMKGGIYICYGIVVRNKRTRGKEFFKIARNSYVYYLRK